MKHLNSRRFFLRSLGLAAVLAASFSLHAAPPPGVLDETHASVRAVAAIQSVVTRDLMKIPGILGTAIGLTGVALFGIGVAKAVLAGTRLWVSGLEFLLVAAAAAGVGYLLGLLLPPGLAG